MNRLLVIFFLVGCNTVFGQNITGKIYNSVNKQPVEYVNIGIVGKNVGTVTDAKGQFSFYVDPKYDKDTILFSVVGYKPLITTVYKLRKQIENNILLDEAIYKLSEVIIKPKIFKQRTLGVTTKYKKLAAGFKDNLLGYECGILMRVKKTAFIKKVKINISYCSYDTIFYRLNIYKVQGKMNFKNILQEPIYIKMPKKSLKDEIQIDLQSRNIVVDGDFLITLEHIKDLGPGYLHFCAGITDKTYYRKTSQGKWETVPIGISVSAIADVEK